jgi:DNA (cytosine-5)-methyltransferase 1
MEMETFYNESNPLRVFEAFGGYGSQSMALERLHRNFPQFAYRVVGYSDIDKDAIAAYMALHRGEGVVNYGDISKIDWNDVPDFDLFTYSFPCTDISQAGQQQGLSAGSGTRSSLLWECERAIECKRPKFLLMENVAALVSGKFIREYHKWLGILEGFGYASFGQVLNSKDYGVPQNRDRIFLVSIRRDGDEEPRFYFPEPFPLKRRLKDVLEDHVDEKYYISDDRIRQFLDEEDEDERAD